MTAVLVNDLVHVIVAVLLIWLSTDLKTRNLINWFVYKFIPFLAGVGLIINLLFQKGYLFQ